MRVGLEGIRRQLGIVGMGYSMLITRKSLQLLFLLKESDLLLQQLNFHLSKSGLSLHFILFFFQRVFLFRIRNLGKRIGK
jgi:hypothetical protein